jgi:2-polyprenyl-3-methyl-5-hydroxy-6-metoxy-1,4-benzoquinol methylase
MAPPTRWATEPPENHSQWLIDRFRRLAAEGADLGGEARFVDAVIAPAASVLDAGCGTGRVGALLHAAGHPVVGVDADKLLIAAARSEYPSIEWIVDDLSELNLREPNGARRLFDSAVLAGNVMPFVAPDTEVSVLRAVADHVRGDGPIIVGFGAARGYSVSSFDAHAAAAGMQIESRFSTWDLRPWTPDSQFAVTILRPDQS